MKSTITKEGVGKTQSNAKSLESKKGNKPVIQPKLTVGQPNDAHEQEADRMAESFAKPAASLQRQGKPEEQVQMKPQLQKMEPEEEMQRQAAAPEEELQRQAAPEEEPLQKKEEGQNTPSVTPWIESAIQDTKGKGSKMDTDTQSHMESHFNADFGKVNIHTDSQSVQMNQQLNANAFTVGNDVHFNSAKYQPQSQEGQKLLAHELTHTIQQGASETVQRQQVPGTTTPTPASIIAQFTSRWGLDETRLANHLYTLFTTSSANLTLVFQTMDALPAGSRDDVAFEMMNPLSLTSLRALAQTDDGRQLMARMRYYMEDGYVSGATDTLINLINQAGSGVATPSTGMSPKALTVQIVEYAGYTGSTSSFQQAVNAIFQQCAVSVNFNTITVNAADTTTDLNDNVLNLSTSGSTSESNNVLTRAAAGNTIVAAMVEDIKVNNLTGFAGFAPPGAGLVAVSNRSNQTHTLAHEIGHFLGLAHVGDSDRLMYGDNNTTSSSLDLTPWECSIIRSRA